MVKRETRMMEGEHSEFRAGIRRAKEGNERRHGQEEVELLAVECQWEEGKSNGWRGRGKQQGTEIQEGLIQNSIGRNDGMVEQMERAKMENTKGEQPTWREFRMGPPPGLSPNGLAVCPTEHKTLTL